MRFALQRVALTARGVRFIASSSTLHADAPSASNSGMALSPTGKKYPKYLRRTRQDEEEMLWDLDDVEEEDERHMSSFGWEIWHQQRDFFNTMRTLERDGPVLEKYRRKFNPPSPSKTPVLVRSVTYAGEPFHPVTPKRTITVPVSLLPLTNDTAIHNLKVIADTRWTKEAPKDAGLPQQRHTPVYASEEGKTIEGDLIAEHGYIKISCESFPEGQMNLKWCMDTLRRLVKESNDRSSSGSFTDIPLPTRHQDSRLRAHGTGGSSYKAEKKRVTIKDFPKEWLPNVAS